MFFSAADLVKKSAIQILYLALKKQQKKPTKQQKKGNEYAKKLVEKLPNSSEERRGTIQLNEEDTLFFCVDLIVNNRFIEIKMVDDCYTPEDWYFANAILQTSFYTSLLKDVAYLDIPKFRIKEGYKQDRLTMPSKFKGELWFGESKYKVKGSAKLKKHYLKKASIISEAVKDSDYESCRRFDKKYKFNEFSLFEPKYKKLKEI